MAKNKLKTHKGTKKVLNIRNSGSITIGHAGARHNSGKKTTKTNRKRYGKRSFFRGKRSFKLWAS